MIMADMISLSLIHIFGMMPIYIGVDGEENQGLCTGSENYWCINKDASEADIQATEDFLNWVITSDTGRDSVANSMAFVTPFDTFEDGYTAENPFVKQANDYIADGKTSVAWVFSTMPSEEWKNGVGAALTEYAQGTGDWLSLIHIQKYHYYLKQYVGRETPLYYAERLSEKYGTKIYLKREDLNHTGAHKINNVIGQILLAKRMGKKKVIAETGAGQHGLSLIHICSYWWLRTPGKS